jgi:transcriptional regulator with XRE-family HTH domain
MKQPELGKRITELRKAKGLTQLELVSKCNITVRTLQRIESGVVTPRIYTLKMLFFALDYSLYDYSKSDLGKSLLAFFRDKIMTLYECIIDLFNLKTNTMKKVSILSAATIVLGICLFFLCLESNAQKPNSKKFVESWGRGIIYFFPRRLNTYVSNMKDTADYKVGRYLVQEYKYKIFLNKKFVGKVLEGDTVIFNNGKITIRKSYYEGTSSTGKGIIYLYPKNQPVTNMALTRDTENLFCRDYHIKEFENKIFLNDKYMGIANAGDTVLYRKGTLIILNSK